LSATSQKSRSIIRALQKKSYIKKIIHLVTFFKIDEKS
jgi:hypothetical protein